MLSDDSTISDVLTHEYPLLNDAYERANAEPLAAGLDPQEPILSQPGWEESLEAVRDRLNPKKVA